MPNRAQDIWSSLAPKKCKIFAWQATKGRLKTRGILAKKYHRWIMPYAPMAVMKRKMSNICYSDVHMQLKYGQP